MGYIFDALNKAESDPLSADFSEPAPVPDPPDGGAVEPAPPQPPFDEAELAASVRRLDERLVVHTAPASMMAEEYRGIRTRLLAGADTRSTAHAITSATREEGKTLTALNLALALGEMTDRRTLVIEGDLRLPQFQRLLRWPDAPGLIQVLHGTAELDETLRPLGSNHLMVLPAGGQAAEGAIQLLNSSRTSDLLAHLRRQFDQILIDTPPVLDVADAGVVGALCDGVIMAVRMNRTPRQLVDHAIQKLNGYRASVSGAVLTDLKSHASPYHQRYGSQYGYGYGGASRRRLA